MTEGPAPSEVVPGLYWSIKRSFVDYVRRMSDGRGSVTAGALPAATDEIIFPPLSGGVRTAEDGAEERFWEFGGDVRFSGHFGMLFVRIAAPTILVRDGVGELTVTDPFKETDDERLRLVSLSLAKVPAPDGMELWESTSVTLDATGTELFNDVYSAGEPFEQLRILLPAQ